MRSLETSSPAGQTELSRKRRLGSNEDQFTSLSGLNSPPEERRFSYGTYAQRRAEILENALSKSPNTIPERVALSPQTHSGTLTFQEPSGGGGSNVWSLGDPSPSNNGNAFLSPETLSTFDEYAANPRFLELQQELRSILFTGVGSIAPSRFGSPDFQESGAVAPLRKASLDLTRTSIPLKRKIEYMKVWISECAPWLDMFDAARHFGVQVPIMAQTSTALLYGILALSARQLERKRGLEGSYDSLELYQESIELLTPILEAKDPNVLVTACVLCCLEMMSVSPRDWRRHVEGCAALFQSFGVNGFSGGLLQAVFWCYARMDLCGAIISDGAESTVLPIESWVSILESPSAELPTSEQRQRDIGSRFLEKGRLCPDMHANYAVYLCAKTCDLVCARTRHLELGAANGCFGPAFQDRWDSLWQELQLWTTQRPPEMLPILSTKTTPAGHSKSTVLFPEIVFAHWAAISSNQLYHTACILMLEIQPQAPEVLPSTAIPVDVVTSEAHTETTNSNPASTSSQSTSNSSDHTRSALYHARRVVGISLSNPHRGCLNNAIQPLFVAGRLLSHRAEHAVIRQLIRKIEETTGWGACWRLKDLEKAWGV